MYKTSRANLRFLTHTPLYAKDENGKLFLFKKAGKSLADMGLTTETLPGRLFIPPDKKLLALEEIQQGLTKHIKDCITAGDHHRVKDTFVELMEETLLEPRAGSLEGVASAVQLLVEEYADQGSVLSSLAFLSYTDYSTALHSVNVMT